MRITKISWTNFRHLADAELRIGPHAVFIGANETGKSSVLRLCHACLGATPSSLFQIFSQRDFSDPAQPLTCELTLEEFDADDMAAFPDEISPGSPDQLRLVLEVALDEDGEVSSARRNFPESGHQRGPSRTQIARFGWSYVPADRSPSRELGYGRTAAVRSVLGGLDLSEDQSTFEAALDAYQNALDTSAAISMFRDDFASSLSESLPRDIVADDLRLEPQAAIANDPVAGVTITLSDGQQRSPISEQSDGVRAIAALSAFGMLGRVGGVAAIDEPETHLHPSAQQAIAQRLLGRQGQTLLATHSADIVESAAPDQIVVFSRDKPPRQLQPTAGIHKQDQIVRFWSSRLLRPLTANSILIVEGPADRILCEAVARLKGRSLSRLGVQIFELDGADFFPKAYSLFGPEGFDLNVTGLVDDDHADAWAKAIGCSRPDLKSHATFVATPDLEGVYADALGRERLLDVLMSPGYFSESRIRDATKKDSIASVTCEDLAAFCSHKRRKVSAALAVAQSLTPAEAKLLTPLDQAIASACA